MKVMVNVGQLNYKKDGVPAEGGRRRMIGTRGYGGRKGCCVFLLFFELKTRIRLCSWAG